MNLSHFLVQELKSFALMECVGVVNIYEKGPEARGGITKDKKRR